MLTAWRSSGAMWFGGRRINGEWRWFGKSTNKPVTAVIWEDQEPGGSENCLGSWRKGNQNTGKTHDGTCSNRIHFVCEKVMN